MLTLKDYFQQSKGVKVVIFAGKGGLGKTTCSAALAYHMAVNEGKKVLCFSTDPQASLSDIFEKDIFGKGEIEIAKNLFVTEIDADKKISDYQQEIKNKIKDMYKIDEIPSEIESYIDSSSAEPAMYESATYDAMAELLATKDYDLYIFDMPPFGHGVRMIAMAEILSKWVDKITEARKQAQEYEEIAAKLRGGVVTEDKILAELNDIRSKLTFFSQVMLDRDKTGFFMVMTPEKMAILDTERALGMFNALGIGLSGIVLNQVYPQSIADGSSKFLEYKIKSQNESIQEIKKRFGKYIISVIPMFPREPKGLDMISEVANYLMNSPIKV